MKVLLVNGSPHEDGCTYTALMEAAGALHENGVETELFHIGAGPVYGCVACRKCAKTGKCAIEGDSCNELAAKIAEADGIIIGSPVYYSGVNGALCALLDRAFYSASKNFAHKPAAAIVSCRRGGAATAHDRLNKYFTISQMPVVPSQYWNAVHGSKADDVKRDLEGLQIMRTLGRNMAWMIKALKSGDAPPEYTEKRIMTNFMDGK